MSALARRHDSNHYLTADSLTFSFCNRSLFSLVGISYSWLQPNNQLVTPSHIIEGELRYAILRMQYEQGFFYLCFMNYSRREMPIQSVIIETNLPL